MIHRSNTGVVGCGGDVLWWCVAYVVHCCLRDIAWCGVESYAMIIQCGCGGFRQCNHPLEYIDETRLCVVCYNQQYVDAINA